MNISANSIRAGNILVIDGDLWLVTKLPEHTKPGKGPAYIQLDLENLKTGLKSNKRLRSAETVEKAQLNEKKFRYLYQQEEALLFMDLETFEQVEMPLRLLGDESKFLKDDLDVTVYFYNEQPVKVALPQNIIFEIEDTPPNIKGSTAKASYKKAKVNGRLTVLVPPYLCVGDKIVVKVEDCSFVEKVD
jgi:elongation factor P